MSRAFHALHDELLVLPNAWDAASAGLLAAAGFPAIGTTSLGVAAANGLPDGTGAAREATLRLAHAMRRLPILVSADLEGGFAGVDAYVAELAVDGINIEDGRGAALAPVEAQAAHIAAIKARTPDVFVNARTDTHWLGLDRASTPDRIRAYIAAGADGVFVPGLPDAEIAEIAAAAAPVPLNVLARPGGPSLDSLAALGVRRVSTGSLLVRAALGRAVELAVALRAGGRVPDVEVPGYAEVDSLAR